MKRLTDKNLFRESTTLSVETVDFDGYDVLQLALYSDPALEGEGIFLTRDKVLMLQKWIREYLGETQ